MDKNITENLMMLDLVVFAKFKQLIKDNQMPPFMCVNEYNQALKYGMEVFKAGMLKELYYRTLAGLKEVEQCV